MYIKVISVWPGVLIKQEHKSFITLWSCWVSKVGFSRQININSNFLRLIFLSRGFSFCEMAFKKIRFFLSEAVSLSTTSHCEMLVDTYNIMLVDTYSTFRCVNSLRFPLMRLLFRRVEKYIKFHLDSRSLMTHFRHVTWRRFFFRSLLIKIKQFID